MKLQSGAPHLLLLVSLLSTGMLPTGRLANGQASPVRVVATHPWQVLSLPSAAELQSTWSDPPAEYGPEPYYGLNGPVTLESVEHDLDTMHSLGFRAVTVQHGYGTSFDYLSPAYFAFFRQFVLEAKRRDMRVWIVDDAGYPSGFAGGKFTAEHPELRMQALAATRTLHAKAGDHIDEPLAPQVVSVTAIDRSAGRTVQLPIVNQRAVWTAPPGDWTVSIVEHVFRTSPTRSDTNPKRVKDGSQSLEDYLDPAATAQFLAFTHDQYQRTVGDEFGKTILGFRGDEPDYSISGLPWTPRFFSSFEQSKGYDIRPYLASLLQPKDVPLNERELRVRADYYDVFANLFRDGFFKPQAAWCAAHGLEYQVHLNHEEMQLQLAHSEGDFFRDMQSVQIPGIDSIWHQIWTDTISDFPRFASSAAHVYGHPRAFTESFAAYRPAPDITLARYILNEQFVRGINLIETMYYPATYPPGHGGPSDVMLAPGFPALMTYVRRLSYLMSMGHPAAEVALLLPSESLWMGDARADNLFVSTERLLSEHQVDFDIVGEDAIGSQLKAGKGSFETLSGNAYRAVIVPHAELLPASVVERLHRFASGGGTVVFLGQPPTRVASRNDLDASPATAADFTWATVVEADLPPVPTPPAQPPASPPGAMVVPTAMLRMLATSLPPSHLALSSPDPALRFAQRSLRDATLFLLFNESAQPISNRLTLRVPGSKVELWDPSTGTVTSATETRGEPGALSLPLNLPPYATRVLVVR